MEPIRILHTSDWHLGKKLYGLSRLSEQANFLDWLHETLISERTDCLIISGDIYDTVHPPSEAQKLFFKFLRKISKLSTLKTYIISGNHDSGRLLEAPIPLLEEHNITIVGSFPKTKEEFYKNHLHRFSKEDVETELLLLPYFRLHEIAALFGEDEIDATDEHAVLTHFTNLVKNCPLKEGTRRILVGHHLFGEYFSAGSEHSLSLSGLETIPVGIFKEKFDYLALGHIHKSQMYEKENLHICYPGSPIPFRFSEVNTKKIASLELYQKSKEFSWIEVPTSRPLYSIRGDYQEITEKLKEVANEETPPLIEIILTLKEPAPEVLDQIANSCKECDVELLSLSTLIEKDREEYTHRIQLADFPTTEELFLQFYKQKYPESESLPDHIKTNFLNLIHDVHERLRGDS